MANQIRNKSRHKYKSHRRQTKKMVGGDFTDADRTELVQLGFNNNDIALLEQHIPIMNIIRTSIAQVNPQTGNPFTPQELIQDLQDNLNDEPNDDDNDELNISGISGDSDNDLDVDLNESFNLDDDSMNTTRESINSNNDNDNLSFGEGSSLNMSDLNTSNASNSSVNTTREEDSFGGKKKRRKTMKKQKRKTMKRQRKSTMKRQRKSTMKKRKGTKQRGGTCYGNGVGANNYDPNFSIHNTNLLKLFPYKPTN